jgi:capsular polysaccharide biosynthesis protein
MQSGIERFAQIVRRRFYLILAVCICGVALSPFLPRMLHVTYHATARLLVVNEAQKDTTSAGADLPTIAQSSAVLERVKRKLKLDEDVIAIRKAVKGKVLARSSIMEVTYRDQDPDRAALIANTVADETAVYYHEIATGRYDDVIRRLNENIAQRKAEVDAVNKRLQLAAVNNPYANASKASDDLMGQIGNLQALRDQAYADLLADRAALSAVTAQGPKIAGIVRQEALKSDAVYTGVEAQLALDEAALSVQRATYTDSNPAVISVREKVILERKQLRTMEAASLRKHRGSSATFASNALDEGKAAGKVASDEARVQAYDGEIAVAQQHFRETFGPGASIAVMHAERDAAQQQYLALVQRLSEAQADATQAASLGTLVVVDRALAGESLWRMVFAYFPLVYGLFVCALALAAAYAAESLDRRLRHPEDLEDLYGRPVFEIREP